MGLLLIIHVSLHNVLNIVFPDSEAAIARHMDVVHIILNNIIISMLQIKHTEYMYNIIEQLHILRIV